MKTFSIFFFVIFTLFSFAQKPAEKHPSDRLKTIGLSAYYQPEDIYLYLGVQLPLKSHYFLESGLGTGVRHLASGGTSGSLFCALSRDFIPHSSVFLGPTVRLFWEGVSSKSKEVDFFYSGGQLGYRFFVGHRWKLTQSAYAGLHHFSYPTSVRRNRVLYAGYAIQLGVCYEI